MFDSFYKINYLGPNTSRASDKKHFKREHLFNFRDSNKVLYTISLEEFEYNTFELSFCLHKDINRKDRFNTLSGLYRGSTKATKVIRTCVEAMLFFYKKDKNCSFMFIGASLAGEREENTKRFRIYSLLMKNLFPPYAFAHYERKDLSFYLLLNKNQEQSIPFFPKKVWQMINEIYVLPSVKRMM
ncbi:hypothetical protein M23134_01360 [Microscilla marina ATCC 23134]|uniref:Uncharacterized protein n=1 Tax=Microscilla marina ATCC 23134 TaxID=313606 RepID=A1ZJK3_MICM2|nr:hypothetical protein M23134_01360 [Microscilla marina ATCC 23134]